MEITRIELSSQRFVVFSNSTIMLWITRHNHRLGAGIHLAQVYKASMGQQTQVCRFCILNNYVCNVSNGFSFACIKAGYSSKLGSGANVFIEGIFWSLMSASFIRVITKTNKL